MIGLVSFSPNQFQDVGRQWWVKEIYGLLCGVEVYSCRDNVCKRGESGVINCSGRYEVRHHCSLE